jgi:hypothetical protein
MALPLAMQAGVIASGLPGDAPVFAYTAHADPALWISFVTSVTLFETNPSLGFYTDIIGANGGPVDFALPPAAPDWVTDLGSFSIDPAALPGAADSGTIRVLYQRFTGDPGICSADCFVDEGSFDVPFQVTVISTSASVPEPKTWALVLLGILLIRKRSAPI